MHHLLKIIPWLFFILLLQIPAAAQHNVTVELHFVNTVDGSALSADSQYTNAQGEKYAVKNCKYYIANISLAPGASSHPAVNSATYFLINEADDSSKIISLQASAATYDHLQFMIGVDSTASTSGAQDGALDPMNGMFWTWNTGYVAAKLEGYSPASPLPKHFFEYHIGGYKKENNTRRLIRLPLQTSFTAAAHKVIITIEANINAWFTGAHTIKISEVPSCTTPGKLATSIADNYSHMFSVKSIEVL